MDMPEKLAHIPEDLVINEIFTRLPAKSLSRCKSVSKELHNVISSDSNFAIHQSCNNYSSTSDSQGVIFVSNRQNLHCLSLPGLGHDKKKNNNNSVGIPDPTLQFLNLGSDNALNITASTNGLVCFNNFGGGTGSLLYVCNPATKQGVAIPNSMRKYYVGLAFDPSISPNHYKLVHPIMRNLDQDNITNNHMPHQVEYEFEVFSSCNMRQEWVKSSQKVILPMPRKNSKPVFAKGILYWQCSEYLLWFDCDNDVAGYMLLPCKRQVFMPELEIGVREGRVVTCTQVTGEGVEVWELSHSSAMNYDGVWKMRHCTILDNMLQEKLTIRMSDRTRTRKRKRNLSDDDDDDDVVDDDRVSERLWMRPLPFEGGEKVYVRVKLRMHRTQKITKGYHKWEKLICFDLKNGNVTNERLDEDLFGYSKMVFGYANNLIPVPKLCTSNSY